MYAIIPVIMLKTPFNLFLLSIIKTIAIIKKAIPAKEMYIFNILSDMCFSPFTSEMYVEYYNTEHKNTLNDYQRNLYTE